MFQQINLYKNFPKPPRYNVTVPQMLQIIVLFVGLLILIWGITEMYANLLGQRLATLQQRQSIAANTLAKTSEKYAVALAHNRLEVINHNLQQQLNAKKQFLGYLKKTKQDSSSRGYDNYMEALAQTIVPNVWLTNISITGEGDQIAISGQATTSNAITQFLQNMTQDKTFFNKQFKLVQLKQGNLKENPYVNFQISTNPGDEKSK